MSRAAHFVTSTLVARLTVFNTEEERTREEGGWASHGTGLQQHQGARVGRRARTVAAFVGGGGSRGRRVSLALRFLAVFAEEDGTLLDNCIMMWGSGIEDGNKHARENLPFILAGRGGGTINTGRFLTDTSGNQGDLLTTLLGCAGIPLDRLIGIATKQLTEMTIKLQRGCYAF